MKVLWLTNNACSASEILDPKNNRGGWLSSLEKALSQQKDEIELFVGFYYYKSLAQFKHGQTNFCAIERSSRKSKVSRYISRLRGMEYDDVEEIKK
ncbi:MAG: hypothetical protein HC819_02205 [Cyclobacteriaceae bacterium]|nr:hypothetical protein [Cyclobacteriaceae bacterium]